MKNSLKIDISHLLSQNTYFHIEGNIISSTDFLKSEDISPISDITLDYKIIKEKEYFMVEIKDVKLNIKTQCINCGENMIYKLHIKKIEAEYGIYNNKYEFYISHNYIDLEHLLIQEIILQNVNNQICSDTCKGLCLNCGINLNTSKCNCKNTTNKNVFAKFFEEH